MALSAASILASQNEITDPELAAPPDQGMAALQAGDQKAFAELVHRHTVPLLNFVWRVCGARHEAEDIVQETLLQLWKNAPLLSNELHIQRWLYRTAYHRTIDWWRRQKRQRWQSLHDFAGELVDQQTDLHTSSQQSGELRQLAQSMMQLNHQQRAILQLCCVQGLSAPETARILQISERAVESRLYRLRQKLRHAAGDIMQLDKRKGS